MLYGQMERELTEGEPWCFGQQNKVSNHHRHLLEQERVDVYQALTNHTEQVTTRQSTWLGATNPKASSLYQLISQYLGL